VSILKPVALFKKILWSFNLIPCLDVAYVVKMKMGQRSFGGCRQLVAIFSGGQVVIIKDMGVHLSHDTVI